ncbi:2,5-diamino-6-(ribosylamino)-4(3H)-pyrimidinone 5'-phosphate reductase [Podila minutissima]|uniref:2,5-diamino-6-ribosylamino-4(3H)-pyrimidinone 5'-phosphate reductase n=1 Tax=Podila minutissima TaxID=64525 RepID=A0A9P5SGX3_9FUNG|nr:2,5-diamino-6-(ribosylamino)-4(3H)-pyrimidinone 5'-phosphate reductase [Podila minutissima]
MHTFLANHTFTNDGNTAPFVTLTFAQSLDGKIAGSQGRQLILSGAESMKATHILRSRHDAILVGIGTVLNDDPRLSVRLSSEDLAGQDPSAIQHPQPVILDSGLRFPITAKLLLLTSPTRPWIFTRREHDTEKRKQLEVLGAKVFAIDQDAEDIQHLLRVLKEQSIQSLMVEGGAKVISTFMASGLVDLVLITIAPVYVGLAGVSAVQNAEVAPSFDSISYHTLGRDVMMVAMPQKQT